MNKNERNLKEIKQSLQFLVFVVIMGLIMWGIRALTIKTNLNMFHFNLWGFLAVSSVAWAVAAVKIQGYKTKEKDNDKRKAVDVKNDRETGVHKEEPLGPKSD